MSSKKVLQQDDDEVLEDSTTAENILAYKELLSSKEAKEFVSVLMEKSVILFGQTHGAKILNFTASFLLMISAFFAIGLLAWLKLIPESTTGVLAGIIIGYFFKEKS